jgi:type IV pilus assembly protein PilC
MLYEYVAYSRQKKLLKGRIEAITEAAAEQALYDRGLAQVLKLTQTRRRPSREELIPSLYAVKTREVVDFLNQLATLVESGIPIYTALRLLQAQEVSRAFEKIIAEMVEDLRGGSSLSQAMLRFPQVFSHSHTQMVRASEQSGNLEFSLRQMARQIEKQAAIRAKVQRAAAYPAFVLVLAVGVTLVLMKLALPPLIGMFESFDAVLPLPTRVLIGSSEFLSSYGLILLGVLLALGFGAVAYTRLPKGRLAWDGYMLRLPVIKTVVVQRAMFQFSLTTGMLLQAGVLLPQALETSAQSINNGVIRQSIMNLRDKLIQGQGLSQPMAQDNVFPRLLTEMVLIGEQTGTLDASLNTLATYYEQRVDQRINNLTSMVEPVLTTVIGAVVVFIALAMILPLQSLMGQLA